MSVLDLQRSYERLTQSVGFVRLGRRTMFTINGEDRAAFLHNFCTADITALAAGEITEAFVLNQKGKLLGHVYVIAGEHCLVVHSVPDQFEKLFEHLDKFVIRDDVAFVNQSDAYTHLFVLGPDSDERLAALIGMELPQHQSVIGSIGGVRERVSHIDLAGAGWLISEARENQETVVNALIEAGIEECSRDALEVIRIESAVPLFGVDATEDHLPQELQRDEKAISFEKGCYLGQETVARIDSLGTRESTVCGLRIRRGDRSRF